MRVVVAMMKHETNTFSPVATPLERFEPAWGGAAVAAYRGTGTAFGAFLDLAEREGAEIETPVAAEAWPSGPVPDGVYGALADAICAAVARGCDAVLLDLHGAMVTESLEDGEGELLARLRALAPDAVIGVALDFHGNLSEKIVGNADVVAGYKTYPHIDLHRTGEQVGGIVFAALKGAVKPVMVWGNRPMLPHVMRQATEDAPMRGLIAEAAAQERAGALAVSVFAGFPHADIHDAGLSVVAVTDGDAERARGCRDRLLDQAWQHRGGFVYRGEAAAAAIARARQLGDGPVLLLDHSDNCGSGGTQDDMTVLSEILAQGLEDVVAFAVHDPAAVASLVEAGVGARISLDLGGRTPMPALGLPGRPLAVSGTVRTITDGTFTIRGPMYTGVRVSMGRTVVLDTGGVEIVVIERHHEPWDTGCLTSLGIDPALKRFIMLKSRVHFRAGFQPLVRHIVECAGNGVTTSDYAKLTFTRVRRPIYPLDEA
ncbi:MAG: microcystin degradation protein MlrC [Azospirillum sp.]|nr:microcystin degradation protein MlrC [Azospirillum sp.]